MQINILSTKNGVGLEKDASRLMKILTDQGHKCFFVDVGKGQTPKQADINIFCEFFNRPNFTRIAKRNYLFPNPEWFPSNWLSNIGLLDGVLCKTRDAKSIFSKYTDKTVYTGFTSEDMLKTDIKKQNSFFHSAGKSIHKGTPQVIEVWKRNPAFPVITLTHQMNKPFAVPSNVNYNYKSYSDSEYRNIINAFQFHLCPSYYEGWGHYLHEAKSTGGIIVTANGAPMNEFVTSKFGYVCAVSETVKKDLAVLQKSSIGGISEAVNKCLKLSSEQISEMSAYSRESYMESENYFKETFLNIIQG